MRRATNSTSSRGTSCGRRMCHGRHLPARLRRANNAGTFPESASSLCEGRRASAFGARAHLSRLESRPERHIISRYECKKKKTPPRPTSSRSPIISGLLLGFLLTLFIVAFVYVASMFVSVGQRAVAEAPAQEPLALPQLVRSAPAPSSRRVRRPARQHRSRPPSAPRSPRRRCRAASPSWSWASTIAPTSRSRAPTRSWC